MWHTWCTFPVCLILFLVTFLGQRRKWEVIAMQSLFPALRKFITTTKKPSNSLILTICQIQNHHHGQFLWNAWVHTFIFKVYLKIPHLNLVLPFHFPLRATAPVKFLLMQCPFLILQVFYHQRCFLTRRQSLYNGTWKCKVWDELTFHPHHIFYTPQQDTFLLCCNIHQNTLYEER